MGKVKTILIIAYLVLAFLVVGTMEFNDHLNRAQVAQGVVK